MRNSRTVMMLALLGAGGCATSGGAGREDPIRVLVYNIHAGTDAKRVNNLDRVAQLILDSRADIALLQEVDNATRRAGGVNQLARLRSLTGYNGVFGKTIDYDGGEYGLAILSRWPILSDSLVHLDVDHAGDSARYEARGALVAEIAAPVGPLRVIDTHLDASRDSYRLQQARSLLAIAKSAAGVSVIGGDFNSEPGGGVLPILARGGWRDAFTECGMGSGLSFPASVPVKRIDYLLLPVGIRCRSASVPASEASDHRPLLVEIFMAPGG